jgi:hypothetical protein
LGDWDWDSTANHKGYRVVAIIGGIALMFSTNPTTTRPSTLMEWDIILLRMTLMMVLGPQQELADTPDKFLASIQPGE